MAIPESLINMLSLQTSQKTPTSQESRLFRFAHLIGLPEDALCFLRGENWNDVLSQVDCLDRRPLVIELASGLDAPTPQVWENIARCGADSRYVFLFGRSSDTPQEPTSFGPPEETDRGFCLSEICFSDDSLWGPLQGLCERWPLSANISQTLLKASDTWRPLITVSGAPWFLHGTAEAATGFLWAGTDLPELSERFMPDGEYDPLMGLLPLLAFLRQAFGNRTWQAPAYYANLTIDDPPVRDRYGFFQPARHIASLAGIPNVTTVGFIPWNWNRTTKAAAEFFRVHGSQLSLCIHGCDHTEHEFASLNRATLTEKCRLALERAERLRLRSGLTCEPVMVFPQARFSKAALAALRETDFLAAAASTVFPVDSVKAKFTRAPARPGFQWIRRLSHLHSALSKGSCSMCC